MKYKILLPVTNNPSYIQRMIETLKGHESNLIVVNNWTHEDVHKQCQEFANRGAEVWDCRFNLGLAATWNLGLRRMTEEDCDFLIILSPSAIFTKPFQLFIDEIIKSESDNPNQISQYMAASPVYLHCFVRTRLGQKQIGYYDENFWPIYAEDTDLSIRTALHQADESKPYRSETIYLDYIFTEGYSHSCAADVKLMHLYQSNSTRHLLYFRKKWGCEYGGTTCYKHPFNDPSIHYNTWEFEPDFVDPAAAHQPLQKYKPEST